MLQGKRIGAVVLAGGRGSRMNSRIQKQYMRLAGRPLITYSLAAFAQSPADEIVLVVGPGEEDYVRREILTRCICPVPAVIVPGGRERCHSAYEGLKALKNVDIVLIHDGARPFVTQEIICRAAKGAIAFQACVVGMPVKDTIKISDDDGFAAGTPDRSCLWQVQTPQAFSYPLIKAAYDRIMEDEKLQEGLTDDAMAVESQKECKVKLVEGSYANIKITTPEDLVAAEALFGEYYSKQLC